MRSSLFIKLRYLRCNYKSNSNLLNLTIKCQAADFVCVEIFLNLGMFIDHILKEITKGNRYTKIKSWLRQNVLLINPKTLPELGSRIIVFYFILELHCIRNWIICTWLWLIILNSRVRAPSVILSYNRTPFYDWVIRFQFDFNPSYLFEFELLVAWYSR